MQELRAFQAISGPSGASPSKVARLTSGADFDMALTPLRVPEAIQQELAEQACEEGVSRNQHVLVFIDAGLRARTEINRGSGPGTTA